MELNIINLQTAIMKLLKSCLKILNHILKLIKILSMTTNSHNLPLIKLIFGNLQCRALIDNGANVCLIQALTLEKIKNN